MTPGSQGALFGTAIVAGAFATTVAACQRESAPPTQGNDDVCLFEASETTASPQPIRLAKLHWHTRPLIVFAPSASNARRVRQRELLADGCRHLVERDVVVIEVVGDSATLAGLPGSPGDAARLRQRFQVAPDAFTAILVGRDGGEKLRQGSPVSARRLMALVDAMPMGAKEKAEREQKAR